MVRVPDAVQPVWTRSTKNRLRVRGIFHAGGGVSKKASQGGQQDNILRHLACRRPIPRDLLFYSISLRPETSGPKAEFLIVIWLHTSSSPVIILGQSIDFKKSTSLLIHVYRALDGYEK